MPNENLRTTVTSINRLGRTSVTGEKDVRIRLIGKPGPQGAAGSFVFKGDWSIAETYQYGDSVRYNDTVYVYIDPTPSSGNLTSNPTYWAVFVSDGVDGEQGPPGLFEFLGEWDNSTTYENGQAVRYDGDVYVYTNDNPSTGNLPTNPTYWELFIEQGDPGVDGDKHYAHVQNVAATDWNVNHGLNKYPSVQIIDTGGTNVEGEIEYIDANNLILRFSAAFTGTAYLN